ncbi:PTS galactitol transporter subunit IIC [Alkalibaculum sp. M08DMB]|uniref:PTS galactitol transporter subunit IIC n=1 Tax=Alkalibaculum sporogenes TaxID=2655001 RepID=A0A6A7K7B6_9FIRM|nr:PTS transporter subunit IIC [Alkalibaculum sporogenes]MPW25340.1 PTS galactitol transporter subunit IIC [Alkalibaculum sporogenes]
MDFILAGFTWIINAGASVMMPIILLILGLALGQKFSEVFRAAITFGIAFIGLNLVIGLMVSTITPVINTLVEVYGLRNNAVDIGWPAGAAVAWGTGVVPIIFITIIATNVIMLMLGWTKTMDIDIWNYWHALFIGSSIVLVGGGTTLSYILAAVSAAINMAIVFKIADWVQPDCAEILGLEGISLPHTQAVAFAIIAYPLNALMDKIPGFNKIVWTSDTMTEKLGLLGEPMILGLGIGFILAIAARMDVATILNTGMGVAAVLVLLPRMIALLMEGLMVISEGAHEFMEKRFPGRELYIGLDAAVAIGHPFVVSIALIMIPITLILAFILPGVTVLPLADLSVLTFFNICSVLPNRGNLFRGIILGTINSIIILYIATFAAPIMTELLSVVDPGMVLEGSQVTSLAVGAQWYTWIPYWIAQLFI